MPFYIHRESVIARYGAEFAAENAGLGEGGDQDFTSTDEAIKDAEAEVNSYVAICFELPLPGVSDVPDPRTNPYVPQELRRPTVDIAVYRLASEHDRLTKERRRRYEDAIAWLEKLAAKKVTLTVGVVPSQGGVTREGPDRIFTRDKIDNLV